MTGFLLKIYVLSNKKYVFSVVGYLKIADICGYEGVGDISEFVVRPR